MCSFGGYHGTFSVIPWKAAYGPQVKECESWLLGQIKLVLRNGSGTHTHKKNLILVGDVNED
jgi:hypothetical protein